MHSTVMGFESCPGLWTVLTAFKFTINVKFRIWPVPTNNVVKPVCLIHTYEIAHWTVNLRHVRNWQFLTVHKYTITSTYICYWICFVHKCNINIFTDFLAAQLVFFCVSLAGYLQVTAVYLFWNIGAFLLFGSGQKVMQQCIRARI